MKPFLDRIKAGDTLVGDGAMGTMLLQRGLKAGQCPELWNIEQPAVLEEIARTYLDAGADILETNTFGGSSLKLAQYGLASRAAELNAEAVRIVRGVAGTGAYVAASCGPSGQLLIPYGDAKPEEVQESFREQVSALVGAGADAIFIETMTDLTEATLAVRAAKEASSGTPVAAAMTFDSTPRGFFTVMGVDIEKAASGLEEAGADIVGSNCGNGVENMLRIAEAFRACSKLPLIIQSNAGLPALESGELTYPESPQFMADNVRRLVALGVSIIGGCCGTTPEHILALRRMVDSAR